VVLPRLCHWFLESAHFHSVAYDIKAYGALSVVVSYFVAERFLPDFSSNQICETFTFRHRWSSSTIHTREAGVRVRFLGVTYFFWRSHHAGGPSSNSWHKYIFLLFVGWKRNSETVMGGWGPTNATHELNIPRKVYFTDYCIHQTCMSTHSGWDLAEWIERLAVNAKIATVLGSTPASSETVESEGRRMKQCWITYMKKTTNSPFMYICTVFNLVHSQILCCFRWGAEDGGGNNERHAGDSNPGRHVPTDPPQLQGSITIFCIHNFYSL
jgi:hypothetical protein